MYYVDFKVDDTTVETVTALDRDEVAWMGTGFDLLYWQAHPAWDLETGIAYARPLTTDESVLDFFTRLGKACAEYPDAVVDILY